MKEPYWKQFFRSYLPLRGPRPRRRWHYCFCPAWRPREKTITHVRPLTPALFTALGNMEWGPRTALSDNLKRPEGPLHKFHAPGWPPYSLVSLPPPV